MNLRDPFLWLTGSRFANRATRSLYLCYLDFFAKADEGFGHDLQILGHPA